MKRKILLYFCLVLGHVSFLFSQPAAGINHEVMRLMSILRYYHIESPKFDEKFSEKVYVAFMESLDPRNCYFQYEDIKKFNESKTRLFIDLDEADNPFLKSIASIYRQRLNEYDSFVANYLNKPLDLNGKDSIVPKWDISYPYNNLQIAEKYLKYRVLVSMYLTRDSLLADSLKNMAEETARMRVKKNEVKKLNKLLDKPNSLEDFINNCFLNAIAQCADPHTEYFSSSKKKEFESTLKSETLSFGFYIKATENDEIFIVNIVPGGPAWTSKQFSKGDQIIAFRIPGQERLEIADIGVDEANEILTADENKMVEFFIKNKDGVMKSSMLEKQKIDQDNVIVKGFFLLGGKKIGYISLPEFYYSSENQYMGCAYDVSKTLEEFKNAQIQGLIMDLRGNGGGSIRESVNLSGLFINHGPVCRILEKQNGISTLKDKIKGADYQGPVIIMVNQMSASAAEIFASALQDYHRAVIVGGQTYGKATGQAIIPFGVPWKKQDPEMGYAKVTTLKLYRINGESNQKSGITPDIIMPDFYNSMLDYKESSEANALTNTKIRGSFYRKLPELPLKLLKDKYNQRMEGDSIFMAIRILSDSIALHMDPDKSVPLTYIGFGQYYSQKNRLSGKIEELPTGDEKIFKVIPLNKYTMDETVKSEYINDQIKDIQTDVYVQETYRIMNDLIEAKKN